MPHKTDTAPDDNPAAVYRDSLSRGSVEHLPARGGALV